MFIKTLFISLSLTFLLSACATVMDGNKQEITIDSIPRGAAVYHENDKKSVGVTPIKLILNGHDTGIISLEKNGYKQQVINLIKTSNNKKHLDVMMLPIYGLTSTVDELSGAGYKFQKAEVLVELAKIGDDSHKERQCVGCKFWD